MTFLPTLTIMLSIATLASAQGRCSCKANTMVFTQATALLTRLQCISNGCATGYVCPLNVDQCAPNPVNFASAAPYRCRAPLGLPPALIPCVPASAVQDPHITGFDGTKFDFQGVPKKTYAIFGRVGGDLLVSRMRASGFKIYKPRVWKTYFAEFGLTTAGPKVRVALVPKGKKWTSRVFVDDKPITSNFDNKHAKISLLDNGKTVHVSTQETKYRFTVAGERNAKSRHLNVDFELLKKPSVEHKYVGVVGMTLNRALGHNVHEGLGLSKELQTTLRKSGQFAGIKPIAWNFDFETTMRHYFEVDELFPPNHKNVATLGGVVSRMLVAPKTITEGVPLRLMASITE